MRALSTKPAKKSPPGGLSPAVERFAREMQDRLNHSGRTGFGGMAFSDLLAGLERNRKELTTELIDRQDFSEEGVTRCAADVANYAMFIALNNIYNEGDGL